MTSADAEIEQHASCLRSAKLHIFLAWLVVLRIVWSSLAGRLGHADNQDTEPIMLWAHFYFYCTMWSQSVNITDGQADRQFL